MATSVTNTAFLVGNGFSQDGQTPTDLLVAAYRRTRQPALDVLQTKTDKLGKKQVFFNAIRSRLESLQAKAATFTAAGAADMFNARKVTSSDDSAVSVTALSTAPVGVSTLKVNRLATNDVLISDQMTLATSFSAELTARGLDPAIATGTKSLTLNGRNYSVTLDGTETNEGVLNKIVTAVNTDADAKVSASLVKNTATTGRLSFTSKSLGNDGAITFTDTSSLLSGFGFAAVDQSTSPTPLSVTSNAVDGTATLGLGTGTKNFSINGQAYSLNYNTADNNTTVLNSIANAINANSSSTVTATVASAGGSNITLNIANNAGGGTFTLSDTDAFLANYGINTQTQSDLRTTVTNTKAGYQNAVESGLNSLATINGISISRSSNALSDVLTGVTLNLNKVQASSDAALTLTTTVDSNAVANVIQPLLDTYNEAIKYLQANIKDAGGNDGSVKSLLSQLRGLSGNMFGSSGDSTKYLSDIGIKIGNDGTLSIANKDTLKTLLESDATKVSKIFTPAGAFASQLNDMVSQVTGTTGMAQSRSTSLGSQIQQMNKRITLLKSRIDREVDQQKKDYQKLQEAFYKMQGQLSTYSSYSTQSF